MEKKNYQIKKIINNYMKNDINTFERQLWLREKRFNKMNLQEQCQVLVDKLKLIQSKIINI
mgnify:CR=1 FL=1